MKYMMIRYDPDGASVTYTDLDRATLDAIAKELIDEGFRVEIKWVPEDDRR